MKKIFVIVITLTLLLVICGALASCRSSRTLNPIDYGKKYILDDDNYYVFNSDKTGYCKYYSNGYYSVLHFCILLYIFVYAIHVYQTIMPPTHYPLNQSI